MNTAPLHLLIAEDKAAHVRAICRAFETAGTKVDLRAVATLREYRACIAEWTPDLALVDLNLPDGRAVEVLTNPPEDAPFPVLVITAFGNQQIVVEVMKAGALDYVVKSPEAFAAMPHAVERVLREWKILQMHKQAEAELARLNAHRELILNSAAEGILGLDLQGNQTFVNPAAAKMLGYESKELLGRPSHSTWHHTKADGSPCPREECSIYAVYRDGKACRKSDEVFWRKDDTSFPVEYVSTPFYEQGQLAGVVVTFDDITERKRASVALQQQADELRARNAELERFNRATVGRELRMIELKREVNERCVKLGEPPRHRVAEDEGDTPASTEPQA